MDKHKIRNRTSLELHLSGCQLAQALRDIWYKYMGFYICIWWVELDQINEVGGVPYQPQNDIGHNSVLSGVPV